MRIGFIQDDADEPAITGMGYAETGANEDAEDGGWFDWALKVFFDFCLVYGIIAIVNDFINYLRAW